MRRGRTSRSGLLQQMRQADRGSGLPDATAPGRVQGHVRLLALFWLAFSAFNTVGAVVLYVMANTFFVASPRVGAPGLAHGLPASVAERDRDSAARKSRSRFRCGMGICCSTRSGPGSWCWSWRSSRCSPTFRSEQRSVFTRCGCCCPPNRNGNTRRFPRLGRPDSGLESSHH